VNQARSFAGGVWDFVVGDDWAAALGVVLTIALTAILTGLGVNAWWVMPIGVILTLALSLHRAGAG
jgi:hypothetical protein